MAITPPLARLIVRSQPDSAARERARAGLLDYVAVTLPILRGNISDSGLSALRSVSQAQDAQTRALLLGYAGHALDYDDFHPDFRGHPSTVILPALLALAADVQPDADALLDAYVIGVEVAGRLGLAATQRHYQSGFHSTATLGTLAAAAAVARLLKADEHQAAVILGIATTQASGLRAQFGSATKPLHAGLAAQSAVLAGRLTLAGFGGQPQGVIEAFLLACCGEQSDATKLVEHWGTPWRIQSPGLEFKPYATCGGTHTAADVARRLRQQALPRFQGSVEAMDAAISRIEVAFPPGGDIAASVKHPKNGIEARFSLEYVIASSLLFDGVALEDVAEGPVNPVIAGLAERVQRCPDFSAPPDELDPAARFHKVTIWFTDAEPLSIRMTRSESLATPVDLQAKLRSCLGAGSEDEAEEIASLCQLATPDSLPRLTAMLTAALYSATL
jgi:2-methylcitrate dehydratase PrpD